jgi:hypothetical protein
VKKIYKISGYVQLSYLIDIYDFMA